MRKGYNLQRLGLISLETRRLRGDVIEVFRIFKVFNNIKYTQFSLFQIPDLKVTSLKFINHFSITVIDEWSSFF